MILINELLYKDNNRTIFKTYCPVKHLFGTSLQTTSGIKELMAEYVHVFDFLEQGKFAVVTTSGEFKWMDLELSVIKMTPAEENMVACLHMRNSLCNCFQAFKPSSCSICTNGIIRNPYNFRRIEDEVNLVFEYETANGTYRITLEEVPSISDFYDHLWSINDLGYKVQELIDSNEEIGLDYSTPQRVCVHELGNDEMHGQTILTAYTMKIEQVDVGMSVTMTKDKIYLDLF